MTFFGKLFVFASGVVTGTYLDQRYKLPNVESKFIEYYNLIKENEPPKKDSPPPPSSSWF